MKSNIYKLKSGKAKGAWQLPLTEIGITKFDKDGKNLGLRRVKFVPGVNSFFSEDIDGSLIPKSIWFDNGEYRVPDNDKVLNALLQAHPWFNLHYELFDSALESKRKLENLKTKGAARKLIEDSDIEKIKAIALAIFGTIALSWDEATCELNLLEFADQNPEKLKKELSSKDYESKYLSALAFSKGIVKFNVGKTAIVWDDSTEGVIMRIAKGEAGVQRLGELLSVRTEESELILQTIGERLEKLELKLPKSKEAPKEDAKDLEIKKLRAMLAEKEKSFKGATTNKSMTLKEASEKFKEVNKKDVPVNKKNDLEWILSKLKE